MTKVYFLRNFNNLANVTKNLLREFYPASDQVMTKIHFGEPGNKFAFTPNDVKPIIDVMKAMQLKPVFIDTPVAYDSPRNTVEGYKKVVQDRGYEKLAPFIISNNAVEIRAKDFTAGVCKELIETKNVLVISHVKGHYCSGFGGAVKNLGMGGVTKETKSIEHNLCKPRYVSECEGCGICANLCPAKSIKMVDGKAKLNPETCWGCSICQIECSYKCLAPKKAYFDDLLGQAASAVINNLPEKTFYINFLKNIVKWCDCEIDPGVIISDDIGILFSDNPVAIDKASVDLINKVNNKDLFREINHKSPLFHVEFVSKYTGKSMDYELVEI